MTVQWDQSMTVNNEALDAQHQLLFEKFQIMSEIADEQTAHEMLPELFKFLTDYVTHHFREEEKYFLSFHYPKAAEHQQIHKNLMASLGLNINQMKEKGATVMLAQETSQFLANWLKDHIAYIDQDYARFIRLYEAEVSGGGD